MFRIRRNGDNLTQGLSLVRQSADSSKDGTAPSKTMLTISIIFAVLVALWGFSGALASFAKRSFAQVKARPRPVATARPVARPRPAAGSRTRGTRPVASA
jgi:hypothetical protein